MDAGEKSNTSQDEDEGNDGTIVQLAAGNLEGVFLRLSVQDVETIQNEIRRREEEIQRREEDIRRRDEDIRRRDEAIQEFKEESDRLRGLVFADLVSVCEVAAAAVNIADYEYIVREWNENQFVVEELKSIYSETRKEALKTDNEASISQAITEITRYQPIRLTSKLTRAVVQEAHLCPKTGALMKCDTWLYAIAAVLGLESDTEEHRKVLYRAIRGSIQAGGDGEDDDQDNREERPKRKGEPQTKALTGINRSPCNLLGFAAQKEWFDQRAGVLVLPIMTLSEAKMWDGGSYSVLVLCNTLGDTIANDVSPDEIVSNIFLNRTATECGTLDDVQKAILLMQHMVKAAAACHLTKHGPDDANAKRLWNMYKKSLERGVPIIAGAFRVPREDAVRSVLVPQPVSKLPDGKIIAKIDLQNASVISNSNVHPAYPDPMLLAFKSSVNWTRANNFQLMAEAEVSHEGLEDDLLGLEVGSSQKSETAVSYL